MLLLQYCCFFCCFDHSYGDLDASSVAARFFDSVRSFFFSHSTIVTVLTLFCDFHNGSCCFNDFNTLFFGIHTGQGSVTSNLFQGQGQGSITPTLFQGQGNRDEPVLCVKAAFTYRATLCSVINVPLGFDKVVTSISIF